MIFYDSIKELPNSRKMLAQKYALWSSGVGNHIDMVKGNIIQAHAFLGADKKNDAMVFLQNAELGIEAIYSEESFEAKELACYVKTDDMLTEAKIEELATVIGQTMTYDQIEETLERLKKK